MIHHELDVGQGRVGRELERLPPSTVQRGREGDIEDKAGAGANPWRIWVPSCLGMCYSGRQRVFNAKCIRASTKSVRHIEMPGDAGNYWMLPNISILDQIQVLVG